MTIQPSTQNDIPALLDLFDEARRTIAALGIDQWQHGGPCLEIVDLDITLGRSYTVWHEGELCGTFVIISNGEPAYDEITDGHWLTGDKFKDYLAIHRVAVAVKMRGRGVADEIIAYAAEFARSLGRRSLRIDTHRGNVVMRRMLEKHGFVHCGTVFLQNGDPRVAYEKII